MVGKMLNKTTDDLKITVHQNKSTFLRHEVTKWICESRADVK